MKSVCLLVALLVPSVAAAESALVIRDDGYYLLSETSLRLVKATCVIDQRTNPGDPPTDPTPDDPGGGGLTERARQIESLAAGVGTHEEAAALAAVMRSMYERGVSGKDAWDAAFKITLNRVSGDIPLAWTKWKTAVDALGAPYQPQFFGDVSAGVASAYDISLSAVRDAANGREDAQLGLDKQSAISLTEILALIKMILELLQDLGVFDPASATGAPDVIAPS